MPNEDVETFALVTPTEWAEYMEQADKLTRYAQANGISMFAAAIAGAGYIRAMAEGDSERLAWWFSLIKLTPTEFWGRQEVRPV